MINCKVSMEPQDWVCGLLFTGIGLDSPSGIISSTKLPNRKLSSRFTMGNGVNYLNHPQNNL